MNKNFQPEINILFNLQLQKLNKIKELLIFKHIMYA